MFVTEYSKRKVLRPRFSNTGNSSSAAQAIPSTSFEELLFIDAAQRQQSDAVENSSSGNQRAEQHQDSAAGSSDENKNDESNSKCGERLKYHLIRFLDFLYFFWREVLLGIVLVTTLILVVLLIRGRFVAVLDDVSSTIASGNNNRSSSSNSSASNLLQRDLCEQELTNGTNSDLRPVPYWIAAMTSLVALLGSCIFNMVKYFVVNNAVKNSSSDDSNTSNEFSQFPGESEQDRATPASAEARSLALLLRVFGSMDARLWIGLVILCFAHLIFIVVSEAVSSPFFDAADGWSRYELIYLRWLNSGTAAVLLFPAAQLLASLYSRHFVQAEIDDRREQYGAKNRDAVFSAAASAALQGHFSTVIRYPLQGIATTTSTQSSGVPRVYFFVAAPLAPIFITHVVPAAIVFLPVTLSFLAITALLSAAWFVIVGAFERANSRRAAMIFALMSSRFVGAIFIMFMFQTMTAYARPFYRGETSWSESMQREYLMRRSDCYFLALTSPVDRVTAAHGVGFAALLLS